MTNKCEYYSHHAGLRLFRFRLIWRVVSRSSHKHALLANRKKSRLRYSNAAIGHVIAHRRLHALVRMVVKITRPVSADKAFHIVNHMAVANEERAALVQAFRM